MPRIDIEPLEPRKALNLRPILCGVAVIVGLVLFVVSFVWPTASTNSTVWSTEQAVEYQSASSNLHRLSHEYARTAGTEESKQVQAELDKAKSEFATLSGDLESAIARPKRLAWYLRIGACVMVVVGAVGFFYSNRIHSG
ncbi:MAG TPA: hypothetical protein VJ828_08445 [Lacipirellulaceae bacterium]|nr:hypothetical protein [Lacipirellulaceae bacterium]